MDRGCNSLQDDALKVDALTRARVNGGIELKPQIGEQGRCRPSGLPEIIDHGR